MGETGRTRDRESVLREVERLRSSIQTLTRSANPLGKLMDFLQEDVDSMQRELDTWRTENKQLQLQLRLVHFILTSPLNLIQRVGVPQRKLSCSNGLHYGNSFHALSRFAFISSDQMWKPERDGFMRFLTCCFPRSQNPLFAGKYSFTYTVIRRRWILLLKLQHFASITDSLRSSSYSVTPFLSFDLLGLCFQCPYVLRDYFFI